MGYIIHSMWSCDFVQEKSVTPPLQEFCLDLNIPETIDIRDSYFGGCTNGIQLYKMVNDKERIGYVDFCSLYLDVFKYQCYPVGQRVNMQTCVFLTQAQDIYKLTTDYSKKVPDFHIIKENLIVMEYTKSNEFMEVNNRINVTVATFCTSYTRMKLWKLMHRLEGCILYHDTDSIIHLFTSPTTP